MDEGRAAHHRGNAHRGQRRRVVAAGPPRNDAARCVVDALDFRRSDGGGRRRARSIRGGAHARHTRGCLPLRRGNHEGRPRRTGGGARAVRDGEPLILWDWTFSHIPDILRRVLEHMELTGIAVGLGFVLAFGLSLLIRRIPGLYAPVTWVAGVLYAIPSLALFALLIPFTGLSIVTAEIGLVSYTLLILVRNIVGGLRSVPPDVREAAIGMGYSQGQLLWRIELPLALAVIIAGVRVAVVTTVGLVTVTALIGQGGLGALIIQGIQQFFATPLVIGAVGSIALAILLDGALVFIQRQVTPWTRRAA